MKKDYLRSAILSISVVLWVFGSKVSHAEVWVDEDGEQIAVVENDEVTIYDPSGFFYFDEMYRSAAYGQPLRFCFGLSETTGIASDCLEDLPFRAHSTKKGQIRGISVNLDRYPFVIQSINTALRSGEYMKLSIDDFTLYTAVILHKNYELRLIADAYFEK